MATAKLKAAPDAEEAKDGGKKSKKKLFIIAGAVLVVVAAAAAYFLLFAGSGEPAEEPKPEPGAVAALDAITINLADGHFLKLKLALQATKEVKEAPDGSKALDLAINQFSNRPVDELSSDKARNLAKKELLEKVEKAYEGEVMDIYFTEFVMQ
ncbi:flagellar basal body-associated FliL family protein [Planomonospora sp. ID67723]|uniref:flagellar basal body-associated FliL family protein n=1 Tax=Planomonospora sp. ID67723 TaxID=2738134 RepID=UPI0018C37919|nr:flagellar basal body-associated FliL family protein [Planomonospora sp. ID67723]MBG0833301.1 flagellar basal body-associated FliL family protein [Planomonospora sp. ID67723]